MNMQAGKPDPSNLPGLRQRVQRVMRRLNLSAPIDYNKPTPTASPQLLHRLHLYQRELEAQEEELRRTQLALENSRARFIDLLEYTSALYDLAPIGYLTLTAEGAILEANLTAVKLLGIRRETLLQQSITHFIVAEDHPIFDCYLQQLFSEKKTQHCEMRMVSGDGSPFFVQMNATITKSILGIDRTEGTDRIEDAANRKQYLRITISDITARVRLEEEERKVRAELETTLLDLRRTQDQMVKQERLAVVGQMAAGVAHDFNNILAAITLYAQIVMRSADLPTHLHKRLGAIVAQSDRASSLIQQILDFSRRTVIARKSTALSSFLQQFVELLQHTLPETIQIHLEIESLRDGLDDVVDIDPSRIQQVLLNLALNARDAMPDGGELRIVLSRVDADVEMPALISGSLAPGLWLRIDVSDTGTGISPQDLPHLFEPFFTTKEIGKGSGLGLSQAWGIVQQHEGEIDVTSQPGCGTTFSLYFPALAQELPALALPETGTTIHGHGELVLVVEDNAGVRTALVSALAQLGYQTLDAKNGQDAADLMHKEGDKVALILTDLIMPVMGGEDLIRTLRSQGWNQPVVVLSGQPLPATEIERLHRYGHITWLLKPPALDQLILTLNKALEPVHPQDP
jgi:PAS domain S-box-containing protein